MESAHDQNLDTRGAWLEIDLARLRRNIRAYKALLKPATRLMCVVKADAYGHGASACAKVMSSSGAQQFAVATVDEGIALRTSGIKLPIVILSRTRRYPRYGGQIPPCYRFWYDAHWSCARRSGCVSQDGRFSPGDYLRGHLHAFCYS